MKLLEEVLVLVCGGVSCFIVLHPPCASRVRAGAVPGLPMKCLISSVVGGVEVRRPPPLGDLSRGLFSQALLVLWDHPGVAPWLSHEGLTKFEGGLGHELVPPGAVQRQESPFGEGRPKAEVGQVALKRPAQSLFLAAGDARLWDSREHEAFGETVLVHAGHMSCPEQCTTRGVVLE
jgi:hypothetical protein